MLLIFLAPAIEAGPRNPKVTGMFLLVSVRFCVIEDPLATLGFLTPSIHRDTSWPASLEARSVSPIRTFLQRNLWLVRQSRFPEVPYYLGLMANFGRGVRRDYALAMSLYKKAAELGSPEALFRIGALFAAGRGVAKNQNEAMQYYIRAAELGSNLAQYNAGMGYLSGVGIAKDAKRALFWLLVARDGLSMQSWQTRFAQILVLLKMNLTMRQRKQP